MTSTPQNDVLNTSIECVLFDLDGTLIDTAEDFVTVVNELLKENDKSPIESKKIHDTVSDGARALVKLAFDIEHDDPKFTALHQRLLSLYDETLEKTTAKLYPGMMVLLDQLENAGIPWGIVTNKPEKYSLKLLQSLNLLDRCKCLVCPDHVEHSKPHPEPILLACEKFSVNTERVVYLGDHVRDIQAAKNADVIAIAAAYGYLSEETNAEDWYADFILKDPTKIIPLLNILKFA